MSELQVSLEVHHLGVHFPHATREQLLEHFPTRTGHGRVWIVAGGVAAVVLGVGALLAALLVRHPGVCGPTCRPITLAVPAATHRYTSTHYGYSLEYADPPSTSDASSIGWSGSLESGNYNFKIAGAPAGNRDAIAMAADTAQSTYPGATLQYTIPQAEIGYWPAAGSVYQLKGDVSNAGQYAQQEIIVMVAIRHGLAIVLDGEGDYTEGAGLANPAHTDVPLVFSEQENTVSWPGDPLL